MKGTDLIQGLKDRKLYGQFFDCEGYQAVREIDSARGIAKALRKAGIPALSHDFDAEEFTDLLICREETEHKSMASGKVAMARQIWTLLSKKRRAKAKTTRARHRQILLLRTGEEPLSPLTGHELIECFKRRGFYGQRLGFQSYQELRAATTVEAVLECTTVEVRREIHTIDEVLEVLNQWSKLKTQGIKWETGEGILDALWELLDQTIR